MRSEIKAVIILNCLIALFVLSQVFELITLLEDPDEDRLLEPEITDVQYVINSQGEVIPDRPLLIPKIIHQTYKTENIPEMWQQSQYSCQVRHPDYQYMFWTDESARDFIASNYSWFLDTYDSYPYNIQRADVLRYFLLSHYGGVYIDLDSGCDFKIDPLLAFPAFVRKTEPTGVSNDVMGSISKHPFFLKVIQNLQKYNRNWLISYVTIMYSTGPLFLSVILSKYRSWPPSSDSAYAKVRLLYPPNMKLHTRWFFFDVPGSSWHLGDAKFLLSIGQHWLLTVIVGVFLFLGLLYLEVKIIQRISRFGVLRLLKPMITGLVMYITMAFRLIMSTNDNKKDHLSYEHLMREV